MTESIRLAFVGDIMCGDSYSLAGRGTAAMIDKYGKRFLDQQIVQVLHGHDLVMGNIECVLSDAGRRDNSLRRLHMRGRPQTCELLAEWGLTAASLANNHILEQGRAAAIDTVKHLRKAGIRVVGAGKDHRFGQGFAFEKVQMHGSALYIGACCMRNERYAFDGGAVPDDIIEQVGRLKRIEPEAVVILSVHWGDEYMDYPSLQQRITAKRLTDAGANLIIGHHPHVVQGVQWNNANLTAYSLGNFIFDSYAETTGWSFILSVTIEGRFIRSAEMIPIERQHDFRPALASGKTVERYQAILARRNELCGLELDDPVAYEQAYRQTAQLLLTKRRKALWLALAKRFLEFRPVFWPQLLVRPVQRRLGVW